MNSVQRIQKFLSGLCMLLGSLLLFVLFYPVLSGTPRQQLGIWGWLPTWPF